MAGTRLGYLTPTDMYLPDQRARRVIPPRSATFEQVRAAETVQVTAPKAVNPPAMPIVDHYQLAMKRSSELGGLLTMAFKRRCFICRKKGPCEHREPNVELAILGAGTWERAR